MESRIRSFLLAGIAALALLYGSLALTAETNQQEQVIQPQIERRDIDRTNIDTDNFQLGLFTGLMNVEDFGTHLVYGTRLGYFITEDIFVVTDFGRTETGQSSIERLSGNIQLLENNNHTLQYLDIVFGVNILPGESFIGNQWAMTSALYLVGGLGGTRFGGNDAFTWTIGTGYRVLLNDWLALSLDARDHIFAIDLFGRHETKHNLAFTSGLSVYF